MTKPEIIVVPEGEAIANELCKIIEISYKEYLKERGHDGEPFIIGLSGGSLPKFFAIAAAKASTNVISWSNVKFIFCDERLVSTDNPESTFGVYKQKLIGQVAGITEDNFIKVDVGAEAIKAAEDYAVKLESIDVKNVDGFPAFQLLLLGMGPDGHTCSLFPGHQLMEEESLSVAAIIDSPKPPPERVTLTFPVLNNARNVVFVSTGAAKQNVVEKVLKNGDLHFPAAKVSPKNGKLFWILDSVAAAKLG